MRRVTWIFAALCIFSLSPAWAQTGEGTQPVGSDATEPLPPIDSLWDYDDPAASETKFRNLLARAREHADPAYVVEVLTQIARAQGLQQKFEESHRTLDEAEAMLEDGMMAPRVRILLERGRAINSSGNPERSIPLFEEALAISEMAGLEFYAVDAAHMLGIVTRDEESVAWNRKAMALATKATDPRTRDWLGSLYNNLGWTYHDLGRYQEAYELFEKDYHFRTERDLVFEAGIARWSMANALRHLGRVEVALKIQMELLERPERKDRPAEGYTHEEVGECLLLLGRAGEAKPHFARAWTLLKDDPWLKRDEPERLARLKKLGGVE